MPADLATISSAVEAMLLERNAVSQAFFPNEAPKLAEACREMAGRFKRGGRILAFGRGPYATDAQHVSVEFVHPVIVGKRALPALDLSADFRSRIASIIRPEDMVMGFGPPEGDPEVEAVLTESGRSGAMTFALPGSEGDYAIPAASDHPFVHQEMIEVLYHTLWETVHVFFEHGESDREVGDAGFLYPFLGRKGRDTAGIVDQVAQSILGKARDDERLRKDTAARESGKIADAVFALAERIGAGGKVITFGNGGSATDANDFALDCVMPPSDWHPVPAISLSHEPAIITAVANDIGQEAVFLRQLIAHADPQDVAFAISTSGSSRNIVTALEEARKRDMETVALLGYDGGDIARHQIAGHVIIVHSDYIPRIQEIQASIYHVMREQLEQVLHGGD